MREGCLLIFMSTLLTMTIHAEDRWITILVHGTLGLGTNLSSRTINHIKHDCIEGTSYERNVTATRENPSVLAMSPTGKLGLNKVEPSDGVNAAYLFSELYTDLTTRYKGPEDTTFYTYGWSGLMSEKRRTAEAREFYCALRNLIEEQTRNSTPPKIRIIGYSYGPNMFLKFAHLRKEEFSNDTFMIDEAVFIGTPVNTTLKQLITSPPFKKIYHIYSRGDCLQRLDLFSTTHAMSHRTFKGTFPDLTQIELKITAHVTQKPNQTLPSHMRRLTNQSPGHVELWSFGWVDNYYRKNVSLYPLCGAVFIPYLIHIAEQCDSTHILVDLRPEQEIAQMSSHMSHERKTLPFMNREEYAQLKHKALAYHDTYQENLHEAL